MKVLKDILAAAVAGRVVGKDTFDFSVTDRGIANVIYTARKEGGYYQWLDLGVANCLFLAAVILKGYRKTWNAYLFDVEEVEGTTNVIPFIEGFNWKELNDVQLTGRTRKEIAASIALFYIDHFRSEREKEEEAIRELIRKEEEELKPFFKGRKLNADEKKAYRVLYGGDVAEPFLSIGEPVSLHDQERAAIEKLEKEGGN